MRIHLALFILLLFLSAACRHGDTVSQQPIGRAKQSSIDALVNRYLALGRFSGVVVVADSQAVYYSNSFGLAKYEDNTPFSDLTAFKVGKVSELILAQLVEQMAEVGKFALSDKITQHLPEIKTDLTIQDLLTHNTRFPSIKSIGAMHPEQEYTTVGYANLAATAPNATGQSDLDYNILALLIEKVSGQSYQKNIAGYSVRLGLENTYFQSQDTALATGYLYYNHRGQGLERTVAPIYDEAIAFGSRGIKSTANDLVKIIYANPEKSVDLAGYLPEDGFSYAVRYRAEEGTATVVLSNRRHPVAQELATAIAAILKGETYRLPLARTPVDTKPVLLDAYSGRYQLNAQVSFEVAREGDSLYVIMGATKTLLIPQSENQFYMLNSDASVRFEQDSTQAVTHAVLLDGFVESNTKAVRLD